MNPPKALRVIIDLAAIVFLAAGVLWTAARRAWKHRAVAGDLGQEQRRLADGDGISRLEADIRRSIAGMPPGHPECPGYPSAAEVAVCGRAYRDFARQLADIKVSSQ